MKKLTLTLATLTTLSLIGCGGGGGSSSSSNGGTNSDGTAKDAWEIQKVGYALNGSSHPTCNKPSLITGIKSSSKLMTCSWLCGEYEGASPVHVRLDFEKVDNVWSFSSDQVSTSNELCHK